MNLFLDDIPDQEQKKNTLPQIDLSDIPDVDLSDIPDAISPEKTLDKRVWEAVNKPIVPASFIRGSEEPTEYQDDPNKPGWLNTWMRFNNATKNITADVGSGLTSPLNVGMMAASGGASAAAKLGLPAIAKGLTYAGRIASVPVTAEGIMQTFGKDKSLGERGLGALETIGGIAGVRQHVPKARINPNISEPIVSSDAHVMSPDIPVTESPWRATPDEILRQSQDPNFNQGMGDPELAGFAEPVRTSPLDTPEGPSISSEPVVPPLNQTGKPVARLRPGQQTPMNIKKLLEAGYEQDGPAGLDGSLTYKYTGRTQVQPVLEAEVPLQKKRRTQAGQGNEPPKPPKKAIDEGPLESEDKPPLPEPKVSKFREAYELSRALMSIDLPFSTSAAFRQALPHVGTKNWRKAWVTSVKSYGSQATYDANMARINEHPLFKERPIPGKMNKDGSQKFGPSFAEEIGVKMTDLGELSAREEAMRSKWAEQIPGYGRVVKASNRAYTAFLNDLRVSTLENMVKDADVLAQGGMENMHVMKAVADFINDTTGRASLKTGIGSHEINLEKSAKLLTDVFFSPRLMASRIRMLNPNTYVMAPPGVRKAYLHAMLRGVGAWWGIASLAELAGAKVSKDPNNADLGKIKIGNTRIDPGGGFQQFLVLGSRMRPEWAGGGGISSSTTEGKFEKFGHGFKAETRGSTLQNFGANKLHPVLKLAWDIAHASEDRPVAVADRTIQMFIPLIAGDITELAQQDPSLIPLIAATGTFGMGTQTYGKKGVQDPSYMRMLGLDDYNYKLGAKKPR